MDSHPDEDVAGHYRSAALALALMSGLALVLLLLTLGFGLEFGFIRPPGILAIALIFGALAAGLGSAEVDG